MAGSLTEYLKSKDLSARRFTPTMRYSEVGNFFSFVAKDEPYTAEIVDDVLTLYFSIESDEIIGCKIKGVSDLRLDRAERLLRQLQTAESLAVVRHEIGHYFGMEQP